MNCHLSFRPFLFSPVAYIALFSSLVIRSEILDLFLKNDTKDSNKAG